MTHKVCALVDVMGERLNCFVIVPICLHLGVVFDNVLGGRLIICAAKIVNDDAQGTMFIHDPILAKKNVVVFVDGLQEQESGCLCNIFRSLNVWSVRLKLH